MNNCTHSFGGGLPLGVTDRQLEIIYVGLMSKELKVTPASFENAMRSSNKAKDAAAYVDEVLGLAAGTYQEAVDRLRDRARFWATR